MNPNIDISNNLVLDFDILNTTQCNWISIYDRSTYNIRPSESLLDISAPGFGPIRILFNPTEINQINANLLGLSSVETVGELPCLPDGLWTITYRICPHDTSYVTKKFLRTCVTECKYLKMFAEWDLECDTCPNNKKLLEEIWIYIQSAKANADICNYQKAVELLQKANVKLGDIECNC